MATFLPYLIFIHLVHCFHSQELHDKIKNERTEEQYGYNNGIPLKYTNREDDPIYDLLPQQYPRWSKKDQEETEEDPANQCALISQVQSVVIQILSTHYEYGKGIHTLHALVDNIQHDVAALKSDLKDNEKSYGKLLTRLGLEGFDRNISKFTENALSDRSKPLDFGNITSTVSTQSNLIARLEKRHKSLRRTVTKILLDVNKLQGIDKDDTEELLNHFIEKQKEINANLVSRVRHLEEQSISSRHGGHGSRGRRRYHGDHSHNVLLQSDAAQPPDKQNTGRYLCKNLL